MESISGFIMCINAHPQGFHLTKLNSSADVIWSKYYSELKFQLNFHYMSWVVSLSKVLSFVDHSSLRVSCNQIAHLPDNTFVIAGTVICMYVFTFVPHHNRKYVVRPCTTIHLGH